MDAVSISVVPEERAGMATGIFITTRVTGEAIVLAAAGMPATLAQSGWRNSRGPASLLEQVASSPAAISPGPRFSSPA
ncbi:hypothetical protein FKV24_010725 [Lysobacter maris]|uniref:Uncharacterized protein n=1 Tax=Marilutibacter maris TaxID=1605891 RepID=A0A5N6BXP4_9GAMM|nr:MFS transporter [Lysobacter maris]KAB8185237.1 hypothetical protein FKV24_010725 [Lysobacter maris]